MELDAHFTGSEVRQFQIAEPQSLRSAALFNAYRFHCFLSRATDELVHRLSEVQQLRRDFAAANRQRSIEQAELDKYRSLVPVQVLVRDLVALELDDRDERNFH